MVGITVSSADTPDTVERETVNARWIKDSFDFQMSLIERVLCTTEEVVELQRMLKPSQLEDISHERASVGLCGHVGCGLAPRPMGGKKWFVDRKQERVWDQRELDRFCSKECFTSYMKLLSTLQDEPAWNEATRPNTVAPPVSLPHPVTPEETSFRNCSKPASTSGELDRNAPKLLAPIRQAAVAKVSFTQKKATALDRSGGTDRPIVSPPELPSPRTQKILQKQFPGFIVNTSSTPLVSATPSSSSMGVMSSKRKHRLYDIPKVASGCGSDMSHFHDEFGDDSDEGADLSQRHMLLANASFFLLVWKFLSSVNDRTRSFLRKESFVESALCERKAALLDRWSSWIQEYEGDADAIAQFVSTLDISEALPGASAEESALLRFVLLLSLEQLNPTDIVSKELKEIADCNQVSTAQMDELRAIFTRDFIA